MELKQLKQCLALYAKRDVEVILKDRHSIFLKVIERRRHSIRLSLHTLFLNSTKDICRALIKYVLEGDKNSLGKLKNFAFGYFNHADYSHCLGKRKLKTKGKCYDLKKILGDLNRRYFGSSLNLNITWFRRPNYKKYSHITFGSFDHNLKLIRINQLLDDFCFPEFFVSFIVYHEMLHHCCPMKINRSGRRCLHTKVFREKEAEFIYYTLAKRWEREFIERRMYGRT